MSKKMIIISLVFLLILGISITISANKMYPSKPAVKYQTLKGSLYWEGAGLRGMLVIETEEGERYLVTGNNTESLKGLRGISLILTGPVKTEQQHPFAGSIEVELFNTYYPKNYYYLANVEVLGRLYAQGNDFTLVTPDQQIIKLNPLNKSLFRNYDGALMLIEGDLTRTGEYEARMNVISHLLID